MKTVFIRSYVPGEGDTEVDLYEISGAALGVLCWQD
jgi:hypothetical protein